MARMFVVIVVGILSWAPGRAGEALTVPEVVEKAEPCVYRVRVRGTLTREAGEAKEHATEKKVFNSTGTGFSVSYLDSRPILLAKKSIPGLSPPNTLGYVVTNSHVIMEEGYRFAPDPPTIRLRNEKYGVELVGELVGHDPLSDLAVIRVTDGPAANAAAKTAAPELFYGSRLRGLSFAEPAKVKAGQDAVAIGFGHALAGPPTVSKGIVGAVGRTHAGGQFSGLLQTDAGINKGNSGGPLLNTRGEVIGVNTYSRPVIIEFKLDLAQLRKVVLDEKAQDRVTVRDDTVVIKKGSDLIVGGPVAVPQGTNFARSCESAQPVVAQLIRTGKIGRPDLGLVPLRRFVDADDVADLGLRPGVIVNSVRAGSPAAKAGLEPGDIVTEVESRPVRSVGDLNNVLATLSKTSAIEVKYVRPSSMVLLALVSGKTALNAEEREQAARDEKVKFATLRFVP